MTPPIAVDSPTVIINKDNDKFKFSEKTYEGKSPWAENASSASQIKYTGPQKISGKLDRTYKFEEKTPVIGRVYADAKLTDILADDELLRDLAITVSRRGVVFFKNQDITPEQQKVLADKLGKLTGKPKESGLHIHPTTPRGGIVKEGTQSEIDPEISLITTAYTRNKREGKEVPSYFLRKEQTDAGGWHSDITFEPVPSDYAILKIVQTPEVGGDTLWSSGYAAYDSLSGPTKRYLEGLTGTYSQPRFKQASEEENFQFYSGPRGNPENVGDDLVAHHPIIRTNPVTGWNSIFAVGDHFTKFDGLSDIESKAITKLIHDIIFREHDIQVRYKWRPNDVAIWDNRSVYHSATRDVYDADIDRHGVRAVGIGERPFFDPKGKSRDEDLRDAHSS